MIVRIDDPKEHRADFPPDLLALLLLPALAILGLVMGPHRLWIALPIFGVLQLGVGALLLRGRRSSLLGWIYVLFGVAAAGAGMYFALAPW